MKAALILVFSLSLIQRSAPNPQPEQVLVPGQRISDVDFRLDNGIRLTDSKWPDRAVLIDFWASWCSNCIAAFSVLKQFHAEYGDKLELGSVNVDVPSSAAKARAIYRQQHLPWGEATLGGGLDNSVLRRFQKATQGSLPMYVLVDADKTIFYAGWGGDAQGDLIQSVRSLMIRRQK